MRDEVEGAGEVPGPAEWAGYEGDLDAEYAHKMFFGKTLQEATALFNSCTCLERGEELLFMPRGAFQYYVFALAAYLRSDAACGDSDAASAFLHLLLGREEKDPGSVPAIYPRLVPVVRFVAENQDRFEADPAIYGSFRDLERRLQESCGAP